VSESLLERAVKAYGAEAINEALSAEDRESLFYDWRAWARPNQLPPEGDWLVWLWLGGRGVGKTRTGAEWVREFAYRNPGCLIALIARTAADVRTTMLEGPSGLLSISPPWFMPTHEASKCKLTWPNGSTALHFSAEEPKGLRGPQFHAAWCDELAAWHAGGMEDEKGTIVPGVPHAWTQLQFTMRIPGSRPRIVVTTTPRPRRFLRDLMRDPETRISTGSTYENKANLAPEFITSIDRQFEGTRLGLQELHGKLLEDTPGALWTLDLIDQGRIKQAPEELNRVVVGVDPSGGRGERGIVSAGVGQCMCKGKAEMHGFVLGDASGVYGPDTWGRAVVSEYDKRQADRVIVEKNFGGDMAAALIRTVDNAVAVVEVTASRGKALRAEPVAALYEQGKVHHIGSFQALETQMTEWTPLEKDQKSPDRLDALVWALTHLMVEPRGSFELWGSADLS
jgi:phage terminase large subunit-like protein